MGTHSMDFIYEGCTCECSAWEGTAYEINIYETNACLKTSL